MKFLTLVVAVRDSLVDEKQIPFPKNVVFVVNSMDGCAVHHISDLKMFMDMRKNTPRGIGMDIDVFSLHDLMEIDGAAWDFVGMNGALSHFFASKKRYKI